jgi:hypothetical protein
MASSAVAANSHEGYAAVPGVAPPEVPFDQASHVVFEEGPSWLNVTLSAAQQVLKQEPLPANGFLRNIWLRIETKTEGNETAGVAAQGFPWNILSMLTFQDQGGHTISAMSGFNWYLADKYGGYFGMPDLSELDSFSGTLKKPNAMVCIPCEITPTGFGALTNMTEATKYQVQPTVAQQSEIYSTPMTTNPVLNLKVWCELWILPQAFTEPEPGFPQGRRQQQRPPLEGTIQFWTEQANVKVGAGENQFLISRMGQMIRTQIFVCKDAEGKYTDATMPDPIQFLWARVIFRVIGRQMAKDMAKIKLPHSKAIETGVFPMIYSTGQGRLAGDNSQNTLLPTVNSTRQELKGNFSEGTITVLTNDLAVAATTEAGRREVPGETSGHEPLGVS